MTQVKTAFALETVRLPLAKLLPSGTARTMSRESPRYKMMLASVREVGIIEPLVVSPAIDRSGKHVLLDGQVRVDILRELGREEEVVCIVATDDEACTYNKHVSGLSPLQEARMLQKAIDSGVREERLAASLNVTVKTLRDTRSKLTDLAPDVIDLLKDKPIASMALRLFKKVQPYRQFEMAEAMNAANTYSTSYAKALFAATPVDQLLEPPKPDSRPEELARVEAEMLAIERDFVMKDETYSRDTLHLQLARAYLKTLLDNPRVDRYLAKKHGELYGQLKRVVDVSSLEG